MANIHLEFISCYLKAFKFCLSVLLVLASSMVYSQEKLIYSGVYTDSLIFKPEVHDTFRFAFYKDGTVRLMEDKVYITVYDYIDLSQKRLDYYLSVNKWGGTYEDDSLKIVYLYKDDISYKSITYQKLAFKESGGCFVYYGADNRYTSYWYQSDVTTYKYDKNGKCIQQVNYYEMYGSRDTSVYSNIFIYDDKERVTEMKSYRYDTLFRTYKYRYAQNYKTTETYRYDGMLVDSLEEYYNEGVLVKSINYEIRSTFHIEETLYFYNSLGLLRREEYYNTWLDRPRHMYKVRNYIYD